MASMPINGPLEYGVVGLVVVFAAQAVSALKAVALHRRGIREPKAPTLVCQQDPIHHQRIKEIHNATLDTERRKAAGEYKCVWQGRDEVRDILELSRDLLSAIETLTAEIRMTRNGRKTTGG